MELKENLMQYGESVIRYEMSTTLPQSVTKKSQIKKRKGLIDIIRRGWKPSATSRDLGDSDKRKSTDVIEPCRHRAKCALR